MKPINGIASVLVVGLSATVLLACENKMERAKQAPDEISYTVARNWLDGTKYVPAEVAHVQQELAILQSAYGNRNYATVLSRAPAVLADATCLATFATIQKSQVGKALEEQWSGFAAILPPWMVAVEDQITALSESKRASKGFDLLTAKSALADAKDGWRRAQGAMAAGDFEDAVATAKDVKAKAQTAATALKFELSAVGQ